MIRAVRFLVAIPLLVVATACGRPFEVKTPGGFVELTGTPQVYEYRAIAPEGVAIGIRALPSEDGDVSFWERVVALRVQQMNGYKSQGSAEVRARDGTQGRELRYSYEQPSGTHAYRVRLFVAQDRVFVIEAGGPQADMDRYQAQVDSALASVRVRCDTFLTPVLASRTCNRW